MGEVLLTATILMCAVLLVRALFGKRVSMGLRYALWALVLVRLLVPVNLFQSSVSVMNAVPLHWGVTAPPILDGPPFQQPIQNISGAATGSDPAAVTEPSIPADTTDMVDLPDPVVPSPRPVLNPRTALLAVWAVGAGATGLYFLVTNLRFYARLRRARVAVEVPNSPIPIYRADFLPAPCLTGLFRPAICAPCRVFSDPGQLRHILAHELAHKRHGDNWWAMLRGLCLCLWWFHPLVWVCAFSPAGTASWPATRPPSRPWARASA